MKRLKDNSIYFSLRTRSNNASFTSIYAFHYRRNLAKTYHTKVNLLQWQRWPTVRTDLHFADEADNMKLLMDIIRSVRNIRAEVNTPMSKKYRCLFQRKMQTAGCT